MDRNTILDYINLEKIRNNKKGAGLDELFFDFTPPPEKKVKYYKQVIPVTVHHFYITEEIKEVDYYLNMINAIRTAEQHDTIFIYLNTPGGNLYTAIQIIAAMKQSQATIITSLEGQVCSAGTLIFLSGDKSIVHDNSTFMIHNYSQFLGGKGNEINSQVKYNEGYFLKLAKAIYGKFLTDDEIKSVTEGKDFWMDSDEVASRLGDKLIVQEREETLDEILEELTISIENNEVPQEVPAAVPAEKPKRKSKSKDS